MSESEEKKGFITLDLFPPVPEPLPGPPHPQPEPPHPRPEPPHPRPEPPHPRPEPPHPWPEPPHPWPEPPTPKPDPKAWLFFKIFDSPLFLAMTVCFSTALAFELIGAISGSFGTNSLLKSILSMVGMKGMVFRANTLSVMLSVINSVPVILIVSGSWTIYAEIRKKSLTAKGFSLIRISVVIQQIIVIIAVIAAELVLGYTLYVSIFYSRQISGALAIVPLLGIIAVGGVAYLSNLFLKTLQTALENMGKYAECGGIFNQIPQYVSVVLYTIGGFVALSVLSGGGATVVLGKLSSAAGYILCGMIVSRCREFALGK